MDDGSGWEGRRRDRERESERERKREINVLDVIVKPSPQTSRLELLNHTLPLVVSTELKHLPG
jgi:hypothetical protein